MTNDSVAYLDSEGRAVLRESVVGFLDVLGFSHSVMTAAETDQSQQCLDSIVQALHDTRAQVRKSLADDAYAKGRNWAIKFFSDNVLLGCSCEGPGGASAALFALQCAKHYQLHMALSGHFVRGALTLGPLCVTEEIIFGSALIESYQLEAKASVVPRIILSEALLKMPTVEGRSTQDSAADADLICRDIDGWWFVNYLQATLGPDGVNWQQIEQHKQAVLASLARSPRHDILPKFGWVSRYHNVFCHWFQNARGYSDAYRIKRVDEESVIERSIRSRSLVE